jgi:hypothetical protein
MRLDFRLSAVGSDRRVVDRQYRRAARRVRRTVSTIRARLLRRRLVAALRQRGGSGLGKFGWYERIRARLAGDSIGRR